MAMNSMRNACKWQNILYSCIYRLTNLFLSTPWLTTRRRTCPICKGDVVRSMTHCQSSDSGSRHTQSSDDIESPDSISRAGASSAPVLIEGVNNDDSDTEQTAGLLGHHASSEPQSSWRNLATLSFSALSGDTIWHQARADRNR